MLTTEQRPAGRRQPSTSGTGLGPVLIFGVDVSPLSLARMVWKRKLSILLVWATVTVIATAYVQRLPAVYSTSALIVLDSQKIPERYVSATVNSDVQDRFATISQRILGSSQLKKIIDQFDLYREERKTHFPEEVLEMMRNDIKITAEKTVTGTRPGAFRISYSGGNPVVLAQVVNQIANLYIEENLKTREEQAGGTTDFIDAQLEEAKQKLDELEAIVSSYKVKHNGELPQQEGALNGILGRLQVELEVNRDAINRAQTSKATLDNSLSLAEQALGLQLRTAEAVMDRTAAPMPQPDVPEIEPVKKQSDVLRSELKTLQARYSDEHPDIIQMVNRLKRVEAAERAEPDKYSARNAEPAALEKPQPVRARKTVEDTPDIRQARERIALLKTQLGGVERELENRRIEQKRILSDSQNYQSRVSRLPIREQEMAKITRDYEIAKTNYRSLLDKKISADMAEDMERRQKAERFTIGDAARVPEKPISPNRLLLRSAGCLMGLLLGVVLGMGREVRTRSLLGEWQIPAGIPVIARIPNIKNVNIDKPNPRKPGLWFRSIGSAFTSDATERSS